MEVRKKITLQIVATIGGLLMVGLLFAWFVSDSTVNVPKANVQANISANANANSVRAETAANTVAVEVKKAETNTAVARKDFTKAATKARKGIKQYENLKTKPVVINTRDLDARERKLLTNLRDLYKAN